LKNFKKNLLTVSNQNFATKKICPVGAGKGINAPRYGENQKLHSRFFKVAFPGYPAHEIITELPLRRVFNSAVSSCLLNISWVGLRGAIPIVPATFPLLGGIEKENMIFNTVF